MSTETTLRSPETATGRDAAAPEDALTTRARTVWTSGDFLPIARSYAASAGEFIGRLGLRPGETVLDVACGTGNLAIPAAKAGARVTGVDIAPNLIAQARQEARAAGQDITFDIGDAESLPYRDHEFETTVTMFGAMFAYRPARAAAELVRVTRPGGRVAMANWTPEGLIGLMLRAHAAVAPPPSGIPSPLGWGDEAVVRDRFGDAVASLVCTKRTAELRFDLPPAGVAELFATAYGPSVTTLRAADSAGGRQLREELARLFRDHNAATDGTTVLRGEYLDVRATIA